MTNLSFDALSAVLIIPAGGAALLLLLPGYRLAAWANVALGLATFLAAGSLFVVPRPAPGSYLHLDDLNIVFIVLNTFVGFTAALFSASYIGHELQIGRLSPPNLRFYHAMYQLMMFGMNPCAGVQQHRPDVGRDRACDKCSRLPATDNWPLFVFYSFLAYPNTVISVLDFAERYILRK